MNINKILVNEHGLTGTLYHPETTKKLPGLILLSGSDGGIPGANAIPELFIEFLAQQGFVVLGLAYFGMDGLPENLENIPLEYFDTALGWLSSQANVKAESVGLIGQSRGAELALLLGCIFSDKIHCIAASAPCSMICGGFPHPNRPAWLYQGLPMTPYLSGLSSVDWDLTEIDDLKISIKKNLIPSHVNTQDDPYVLTDLFFARNSQKNGDLAAIPVEKIKCPMLLLSGDQDDIWPATDYCKSIMARLDMHRSGVIRKHVRYPQAGHGLLASYNGSIFHPKGQFWCRLGGTEEGNKSANENSWAVIAGFLQDVFFLQKESPSC